MSWFGKKEEKTVSESDLKRGLKKKEFVFYYQPEFNLKTGEVIGVEALMRWNAPNGIIPPNEFIPVLEQSGLITEFTEFLLRQTLTDLKEIQQAGAPNAVMAINVSATQLNDPSLIGTIKKILEETKTESKFLECEITESQQLALPETHGTVFNELENLGISLAMDDFGTGYSSFNYLRYLNIKKLKIDCGFVRTLEEEPKNKKILPLIIKLGHDLGIPVLAEGIETTDQKEWLERNECDFGQGFWFSRPLPMDQLVPFLEKKKEN